MNKVIIVGSGASAVQCAFKLLEEEFEVIMLDYGKDIIDKKRFLPNKNFSEIRENDINQHKYFLGNSYEGISFENMKVSNKLPPYKKHILETSIHKGLNPNLDFIMNYSLAKGGLAQGWGAGCLPLTEYDYKYMPISEKELEPFYNEIALKIGISANNDMLSKYYNSPSYLQKSLDLDYLSKKIIEKYNANNINKNFILGRAWLAVVSEKLANRDICDYSDMELWGDKDKSVYRPYWSLEDLAKFKKFKYFPELMVTHFSESKNQIEVFAKKVNNKENIKFMAKGLFLAAGVPNSAGIVANSYKLLNKKNYTYIKTNQQSYIVGIYLPFIKSKFTDLRCSLAQMHALFKDQKSPEFIHAGIYTYRSLLYYRIIKSIPASIKLSFSFLKLFMPSILIFNVFHGDYGDHKSKIWFKKNNSGKIKYEIEYQINKKKKFNQNKIEWKFLINFLKLGFIPLKIIRRNPGTSIHTSGTLPLNGKHNFFSTDKYGKLKPSNKVWCVDGSTLPFMPAVLPTFTIMANSIRVTKQAIKNLK